MNLIYDNTNKVIQVKNSNILLAITNPSLFSTVTIKSKLISNGTETTINGKNNTSYYTTIAGIRYLTPAIVGSTSSTFVENGIYEITFTLVNLNGTETIKSCILVDNDIVCLLTKENDFLKHYILKAVQFCTCDCEQLNDMFNSLTMTTNDCTTCK